MYDRHTAELALREKREKKGVTLVPLSIAHLDHVMEWVNDRDVVQYFAARQTDITKAEELKYLKQLVGSETDRAFSIITKEGVYVGQCSINQIHWPSRNGRLFVVIKKNAQGNGYGPAAVQALLDLAWTEMKLHKVFLIVRSDNREAQARYLKLGFNFEGLLRDEYRVGERYFDMVRMGILNPHE